MPEGSQSIGVRRGIKRVKVMGRTVFELPGRSHIENLGLKFVEGAR